MNEFFNAASPLPDDPAVIQFSSPVTITNPPEGDATLAGGGTLTDIVFDAPGDDALFYAPEPGTLSLLGFGFMGAAALRRRRRA